MKNKKKNSIRVRKNQEKWRERQKQENKKVLTVWIDEKKLQELDELKADCQDRNRSETISRLIDSFTYANDKNGQKAANLSVEAVPLAKSTKERDAIILSDFDVSGKGDVVSCPRGHAPVRVKTKKTRHTVEFGSLHCIICPFQEICPVKQRKKYHYLRYTDEEMRLVRQRDYEEPDELKDLY